MKRLLMTVLLLLSFFFITGCEKDAVVAPEGKEEIKQSEEVGKQDESPQDVTAETEEAEGVASVENTDEAEETEVPNKEPSQQVTTKSDSSSQPKNNNNNQSAVQESTKSVNPTQSTKNEQPKASTEKAPLQEKASNSATQKPTPEKSKEAPPAPAKPSATPEPAKPKETVTISIAAPDVKETILPVTSVEFKEGDTVLSVTQRIVRERGIQISVTGAKATAYVQGIDNLYEFDHGPLSGWEAFVNGQGLDRSAGVYGVQPGQAITWRYTTNYME